MKNLFFVIAISMQCFATAQLNITNLNQDLIIDFDNSTEGINNSTFNAGGFNSSPAEGQLNSNGIIVNGLSDGDMVFGETYTDGDYGRKYSLGGVSTGGIYAFEVSSENIALGIQPTGSDIAPGEIIIKISNNQNQAITHLSVSYDVYHFNNENRSSIINFCSSADNQIYTDYPELNIETLPNADTEPVWTKESKSITITSALNQGDIMFLKWTIDDLEGSGSRDELALDNIIINASGDTGTPTDVNKKPAASIKIFPNPCHNKLMIESAIQITNIEIFNSLGQPLNKYLVIETTMQTISTDELSNGVYLIRVTDTNNNVTCSKIIKR